MKKKSREYFFEQKKKSIIVLKWTVLDELKKEIIMFVISGKKIYDISYFIIFSTEVEVLLK